MPKRRTVANTGGAKRMRTSRNQVPEAASINTPVAGPSTAKDGPGIDLSGDAEQPMLAVETQTVTDPAAVRRIMDNANEDVSKCLHEVLDGIGASEYTRKKHWDVTTLHEIRLTFLFHFYNKFSKEMSIYVFGSACEGTTTPGLHPDIDILICDEDPPVVDNLVESKQQGKSYLILTDGYTKPGYVRLQIVKDRCPLSMGICVDLNFSRITIDWKGRLCFTHSALLNGRHTTRNGPADTISADLHDSCQRDLVYALRCRQIPKSANTWLDRTRKYNWPSQKQLKAMGSYGCFLVGVGHPNSENKSIEWRISFSLQERDLMSSLNETQHKCYILLKMIKKSIIEPKVGESISSYHCKTSLFYTIENSQRHFWTNDKLKLCVQQCLKRLFIWVIAQNCPNYFIPKENMFDKLSPMTLTKTEDVLRHTINSGVNFLYDITCDNVGTLLQSKMFDSELVSGLGNTSTMIEEVFPIDVYNHYLDDVRSVYNDRNEFLYRMHMSCNTYTGYLNETKQLLVNLRNTNDVTEHNTRDVRMALDSIIPHIQLQYEQCMFAQYSLRGDSSIVRINTIPNVFSESSDCDLISSKLSLASLYIKYEQLEEECKSTLESCENSLEPYVLSVCTCGSNKCYGNPTLDKKLKVTDISSKDFRRGCTTGCMAFMPSQVSLVHESLQYELFRTVFTNPGSIYEKMPNNWLNWITVDSQIYLYFLQYLLFSKPDKSAETNTYLSKLLHVLEADQNLGHKETGYNLLGWIRLQENDLRTAWRFLCRSWKIRSFENAAKWHMLILISEKIKEN